MRCLAFHPWVCRYSIPVLAVIAFGLSTACGSSGGREARSGGGSYGDGEEDSGGSEVPPHCTDGTCFGCGEVICPTGFYCDENAAGGPGCSWLPECADQATCDCVTGVLGDACSCDERDGGIYLTCS